MVEGIGYPAAEKKITINKYYDKKNPREKNFDKILILENFNLIEFW